jgi:excisionase family DNA binding protein
VADALMPITGTIPEACRVYGLSRASIYRLAGDGKIRLVKVGGRTLVWLDSLRDYLNSAPLAEIRPSKGRTMARSQATDQQRTGAGRSGPAHSAAQRPESAGLPHRANAGAAFDPRPDDDTLPDAM